jgi:hypothetical protein
MKFECSFHNPDTGESRSLVATLSPAECEVVHGLRAHGDDSAEVIAQSMALKHLYAELNPHQWQHVDAPELIRLS